MLRDESFYFHFKDEEIKEQRASNSYWNATSFQQFSYTSSLEEISSGVLKSFFTLPFSFMWLHYLPHCTVYCLRAELCWRSTSIPSGSWWNQIPSGTSTNVVGQRVSSILWHGTLGNPVEVINPLPTKTCTCPLLHCRFIKAHSWKPVMDPGKMYSVTRHNRHSQGTLPKVWILRYGSGQD